MPLAEALPVAVAEAQPQPLMDLAPVRGSTVAVAVVAVVVAAEAIE